LLGHLLSPKAGNREWGVGNRFAIPTAPGESGHCFEMVGIAGNGF
jgi:hypothetical protein